MRRWKRILRGERGQALVEEGILLATLLGALVVGGTWVAKTHPGMMKAIDTQIRGDYFLLSLPFP
ncbi:MAG: hypothetical protein ACM3PC_11130 [Deltaproteobacteria bacterium]